ncbi:MAG TPA: efflux RND transporter periplasmic adaptor subunit [Thermoanaerobaculia bacterium]|nr:efflux RND transporter periplasmic adaptor subunit [Thermoanaerobaculia bacterium]
MASGPPRPLRWLLAAAGALVVLLLAANFWRPTPPVVNAAKAAHADLVVSILCDGTLEPAPGGELRALDAATVAAVLVNDGDRVRKGEVLVRLESPLLSEKAREARAEALKLAAERTQAAGDADRARRELAVRRRDAEADRRLLAEKAVTQAAADASVAALREAEDRLRSAEARLASLVKEGNGAPSRLELVEASARDLEGRVAALTVRAPRDGMVYGLPRKTGEAVAPGQIVAGVADPASRIVRARVDQPDLPRIAPGLRMRVTFDGLPEKAWEGTIARVSPGLRDVGGREVSDVLGEIRDPSGELPPNASVSVEIVAGEKKGALVVPRGAIVRDGEKRFVWVPDGGRARRRDVAVGLMGLAEAEVTAGLAAGDAVLLPGTTPLADGERIQITRR